MSSVPLSDRLQAVARALMAALGDRRRGLPLWAVMYLQTAIERLRRGAVDLLRKLEAGTYRPRKPGLARRPSAAPRAPNPPPAIRFPNYPGILSELIGNERPVFGPDLRDLLQDPALPGYVQTCPALGRRLRPLCRLVGIAIPAWLRAPPRPRRARATQAPGARAKRPPPDPAKPNWRMLRDACRANYITRTWGGGGPPPHVLVHGMRHLLSREVIDLLRPHYKFLNVMYPR
jgi:hypothetical protein